MEIKVGSEQVPLEGGPRLGDKSIVAQVARFKPFVDWAAKLKVPDHVKVVQAEVESVHMVVKRLANARVALVLQSAAGERLRESVVFCEDAFAALVVVVAVDGVDHVVLVAEPQPAVVRTDLLHVPYGIAGTAIDIPYSDLLSQIGISLVTTDYEDLGDQVVPGASGVAGHKYYLWKMPQQASFKDQFPLSDDETGVTAHLLPISEAHEKVTDVRTLAALALLHQHSQPNESS